MKAYPFSSFLLADVGMSLGDEGKGRLIYELYEDLKKTSHPLHMVIKINGGANSGHTIHGHKLNLLPAGIVIPGIPHMGMGAGVVADPRKLLWETQSFEAQGFNIRGRLLIDAKMMVSDIMHRILDVAWENYRVEVLGSVARGTTARGISPSYSDETSQWQIHYSMFLGSKELFAKALLQRARRACDVAQYVAKMTPKAWFDAIDFLSAGEKRANGVALEKGWISAAEFDFRSLFGTEPFTVNETALVDTYWAAGQEFAKNIGDLREFVLQALDEQKPVLGEFGQSYWLDKRHGYAPNVSASHTYTPEIFQSLGIPVRTVHTLGVVKAYDTGVGSHFFPTAIATEHPLGPALRSIEFGTTTGRQRLVGWFDAVRVAETIRYGGCESMMINKLDVMTQPDSKTAQPILLCVGYRHKITGELYHSVPRLDADRRSVEPVYESYAPWHESIGHCRHFNELPVNAKNYIRGLVSALKRLSRVKHFPEIRYVGVGAGPGELIRDITA